jgi:ABC-type uncharacterized transport system auxiliary subunit
MDRPFVRRLILLTATLMIAALPSIGCQSALFTAMYLLKGMDVDPDFKELKGKKVAVVCRPTASLTYSNSNVARDLAQQVTRLLQEQVPKIKTIDQRKVAKWTDENTWEEYSEVGKALKADMVVAVDLESFSIYQGQTLYQGKADATIRVFDCSKTGKGKEVFRKSIPQAVYPPNMPIPAQDRTEPEFRREFVLVLANQIGRHFFAHDPHADLAQDAAALR